MPDPLSNLVNGLVSGFEAETGRKRLQDAAELGGTESALTNSGFNLGGRAKTLRPPKTFTDSVFTGFRNASLTPEQRLNAERATYLNESTQLDIALKQQSFNEMRQGSRGIAELSDLIQGISDPRERYRVIASNPRLARTAPKQYTALLDAAKQEIDMEQQIRKERLEMDKLDREIAQQEFVNANTSATARRLSPEGQAEESNARHEAELFQRFPKLRPQYEQMKAEGDLDGLQTIADVYNKDQAKKGNGRRLEIRSDGTIIQAEGSEEFLNTATKSFVEKGKIELDVGINAMEELEKIVDGPGANRAFGLVGKWTDVRNLLIAQAVPSFYDPAAADVKLAARGLRELAVRSVSSDSGRLSDKDFARIEAIFPDGDTPFTSLPQAKRAIRLVIEMLQEKREVLKAALGDAGEEAVNDEVIILKDGTKVFKLK